MIEQDCPFSANKKRIAEDRNVRREGKKRIEKKTENVRKEEKRLQTVATLLREKKRKNRI